MKVTSPRKRAGVSSIPPITADAPNVVWAIDFQFDSTGDGKAIKIASMIDEHTRVSLLNIVDRSITAERLVTELQTVFATAGGPPIVLRMDNGPEFISQALQQFCDGRTGMSYIPPGTPWNNGYIESFNNRRFARSVSTATTGTPRSRPAWSSATSKMSTTIGTATRPWATEHRPSTLRSAPAHPSRWPAALTESGSHKPDSNSGWTQKRGLANNALAETTIGLYKNECIRADSPLRRGPLRNLGDVELITADYVAWYNQQRLMHLWDASHPLKLKPNTPIIWTPANWPAHRIPRVHETRDGSGINIVLGAAAELPGAASTSVDDMSPAQVLDRLLRTAHAGGAVAANMSSATLFSLGWSRNAADARSVGSGPPAPGARRAGGLHHLSVRP